MSHRPGIKNFPVASTTRAPAGAGNSLEGPSPVIRPPEMITLISALGGAPVAAITVACVNTSGLEYWGVARSAVITNGEMTATSNTNIFLINEKCL